MHMLKDPTAVLHEDEDHLLKNESSENLLFFNNTSVEHCTAEYWG